MAKMLTIVGLLLLLGALALPGSYFSPVVAHHHAEATNCCCPKESKPLPLASCGCRTCPASAAVSVSLIVDSSKCPLPAPDFQSICWKTSPARAEARFAEPLTPPPRVTA